MGREGGLSFLEAEGDRLGGVRAEGLGTAQIGPSVLRAPVGARGAK